MAYNKNNYENNRLTSKQETFAQEIAKGKSQRQAYYIAYPNSKKWLPETVDAQASKLANSNKVIIRLQELRASTERKVQWTREKALRTINKIIEVSNEDMDRINQAYEEEQQMLDAKLMELAKAITVDGVDKQGILNQMNSINEQMIKLRQKRRTNGTNINAILNASKILNRMMGYDITKVEIQTTDEERENMKALTKEELKALAYANSKKENE